MSKGALAVALIGGIVLGLTYLPALRPYFDGRATGQPPRETTPTAEPTRTVATEAPAPAPDPKFGLPARLVIPKLGVDAEVVQVGVDKNGVMESPKGPGIAGWYKLGTKPGERGSAVVAGHSGYRDDREAIFDHLKTLATGDSVTVVDETGVSIAFTVRESRLLDPNADTAEIFGRTDGRFLNLVTCTGDWNASAGTHSQRLVVFCDAVP